MIDPHLLVWASNHEVDADSRRLLSAAANQLRLLKRAEVRFREIGIAAPNRRAFHADTGTSVMAGLPAEQDDKLMAVIERRQPAEIMAALEASYVAPAMERELLARAFVYELALYRKIIERAQKVRADLSGYSALLQRIDAVAPGVVALRDSLAHLDERVLAESRGRDILAVPTTENGETINLGLRLSGSRFGGHAADGQFAEVDVSEDTLGECASVLWDAYGLFTAKPTLEVAMENSRRSMGNMEIF